MIHRFSHRLLALPTTLLLFVCSPLVCSCAAQNIEINGQQVEMSPNGARQSSRAPAHKNQSPSQPVTGGFGWGSNIGVARESRAAEQSLKTGNYAQAATFAER